MHELVDAAEAADDGLVFDNDVAGEGGSIGHDHLVADDAVVGYVAIGHDVIVVCRRWYHRHQKWRC